MIANELKKLLKGAKGCDPKSELYAPRIDNLKNIKKGRLFKIGAGGYGVVYFGCIDDACQKKVAIKFTSDPSAKMEYTIAKKLEGMGVPVMYHYKTCDNRDVLYSEYIDGVPFEQWMKSNPGISEYKSVIRQIVTNLYNIHKKFPNFRHHDLHWNNIIVTKNGKVVMIDFGFAVMKGIKNPRVNAGKLTVSGISRASHPMYDLQYILYIIHRYSHSNIIKNFIWSLFKYPNDYLYPYTDYVSSGRLKLVKHKELPTFEDVLNHPFLSEKKKHNVLKSILSHAEKTKPVPFKPILKKQLGSKEALEKAKQILAKNKPIIKKPIPKPKPRPKPKSNSPRSKNNVPLAKLVPKPKSNSPRSKNDVPLAKLVPKPKPKSKPKPKPKPKSNSPRSKNNVPLAKLVPKSKNDVPLAKLVTINKNNEVKIGRRKCRLYKKDDLVKIFNMNPKLKKSEICIRIKNLIK